MRLHARLPKSFWVEALNTAVYLVNHGPSVPLNMQLPEEAWSGKKVSLSHLRVFGAVAYLHIDEASRDKLDAKVKKCVFVGYGEAELGYRLWDISESKVVRGQNVVFNEKILYKDLL